MQSPGLTNNTNNRKKEKKSNTLGTTCFCFYLDYCHVHIVHTCIYIYKYNCV